MTAKRARTSVRTSARLRVAAISAAFAVLAACQAEAPLELSMESYRSYLETLASDEMEGRGPGAEGGEKAAAYIAEQYAAAGLKPVEGDSYYQMVPLVGIEAEVEMELGLYDSQGNGAILSYPNHFVAWAGVEEEQVSLKGSELVFVGYGIRAPEVPWDDYKGQDLKGKTLLSFVNDPPSEDPSHFGGKALTYYGRWTYKLEEAARQGAAGILLIHDDVMAGYGWGVVRNSWSGEQFSLPQVGAKSSVVEAWIQRKQAEELLASAGLSMEQALEMAAKPDFQPVDLKMTASIEIKSTIRRLESPNVIGVLEGSDPELRDEYVIYTAHYDHFGIGFSFDDDKIFNGALDNSSGTAAVLELARVMAGSPRPRRSIIFACVTAEEQGLLGSAYYAQNPLFPLSKTAANVNLDVVNVWGRTRSLVPLGSERSGIRQVVEQVGQEMQLGLAPDPSPEQGLYFRSDHFSLAKVGVPAVSVNMAHDFEGHPVAWGDQLVHQYRRDNYHKPSDEYDPTWSLEGAMQTMEFARRTALLLADQDSMPEWQPGDAFEAARKESIEAGR